jgi:serine/threonine protein kinase/formylglycine-generating enzyme required for sulfatase activity
MTGPPHRKDRARELFDAALERAVADRAAFLDGACAGDSGLRRELDSLLELHAEAEEALRDPLAPVTEQPGDRIGPYKLLQKIGEGGFGTVFMADQEQPLQRRVALKIIKLGMDTRQVVARFEHERQALALMDHPNIARVLDAGATERGRPYFVMDLVKGEPIARYCDTNHLDIEERLQLFDQVCAAVQHAHQKGVIHRDIKPSNILVSTQDGRPHAKVIDFGISKATASKLTEKTFFTEHRQLIGTPEYMSPEQAEGSLDIDTRTDVYSLGVVLYELLTGSTPFDAKGLRHAAYGEIQRIIREVEPPKPSTRLSQSQDMLASVAANRHTEPKRLGALVGGELDWIVMKALEKDRQRRYATAAALAEDIQRHLRGEAVQAGPPSRIYKLRKYVQRHRIGVAVVFGIVAGTAIFLGALQAKNTELLVKNSDLDTATRIARENEAEAQRQEGLAKTSAAFAEERRTAAEASEKTAKEQEARAQHEKANVLLLSTFQTLDDLTEEAEALWPAEPGRIDDYREWMRKAKDLVARLPELRSSLREIEQRAVPQSAEEIALDRSSHPRAAELDGEQAELAWMKRMLGEEVWPSEAEVERALSEEALPVNARELNALAYPFLRPHKPVYGSEVRALLLVRRALAAASVDERTEIFVALAWANFNLGRFEEAIAAGGRALESIEPGKREESQGILTALQEAIDRYRDPKGRTTGGEDNARRERVKERDAQAERVAALEAEVSMRRTWRFAQVADGGEAGDRWWHHQLQKLVATVESFMDPKTGLMGGLSAAHGWGVEKRLDFASSVEERTVTGESAGKLWSAAIAGIATSPKYGGLRLEPQVGLLPIGADPASGLWEFAHVQSGEPAKAGADGKLVLTDDTGLVFVLIPGGTFWMGAQCTDAAGRNYDPDAWGQESPVHEVTLSPYFLSKYEMTSAQWKRFTGDDPSRHGQGHYESEWNRAGKVDGGLHPVEQVTWTECRAVLRGLGCTLPSEAQWECGCRGGTNSAYWSGDGLEGFGEVANISDVYAQQHGGTWPALEKGIDDGNTIHGEVGSYRANPYGLHDVHGNVWEWCLDGHADYSAEKQVDPVVPWRDVPDRVTRGGGFIYIAAYARSAYRNNQAPERKYSDVGLRPAKALHAGAAGTHPAPR